MKSIKQIFDLDKLIEKTFIVLVCLFPFSTSLRNIFIGIIFILYIVKVLISRKFNFPVTPYNKYIIIFFGLSLISLINANNIMMGIEALISPLFKYIVFYFLAWKLINHNNINRYLNIIFISNFIFIIVGIYLEYIKDLRVLHSNQNATMISFMILFFLSFLLFSRRIIYKKIFILLGIGMAFMALFTTNSRGAVLGFYTASGIWIIFYILKNVEKYRLIVMFVCIGLLLLTPFMFPDTLVNKFDNLKNVEAHNSLKTRVVMWKSCFYMMKSHPLLGVGVGNFQNNYLHYLDEVSKVQLPVGSRNHSHPHNLFLFIGAEQGIISIIIFLSALYRAFRLSVINYFKRDYNMGLAFSGILISLFIHSLVDTTVRYGHVGFYVILFLVINYKMLNQRN